MNAIAPGIVTGLNTLKDGTLKVVLSLQETTPEQAGQFFQLMNQFVKVYMTTENVSQDAIDQIDEWEVDTESKSPSKRLRNVLYRYWEQDNKGYEDYELYYRAMMEKIINAYKDKLT